MPGIRIEKLAVKDVELLQQVALKSYDDHYLHLWYDDGKWYKETYFSVERLRTELNNPNSHFYLAYFNELPAGFLKLNIDAAREDYKLQNALELERIYLKKEIAGKGVGRALVEVTIEVARKNNKSKVWLKAMDTSDGPIAFYKKMGFNIMGTHQLKHPLIKHQLRGMVIMVREL